jgi:hypothetical protein
MNRRRLKVGTRKFAMGAFPISGRLIVLVGHGKML